MKWGSIIVPISLYTTVLPSIDTYSILPPLVHFISMHLLLSTKTPFYLLTHIFLVFSIPPTLGPLGLSKECSWDAVTSLPFSSFSSLHQWIGITASSRKHWNIILLHDHLRCQRGSGAAASRLINQKLHHERNTSIVCEWWTPVPMLFVVKVAWTILNKEIALSTGTEASFAPVSI